MRPGRSALLLVDHGSRRDDANAVVQGIADLIRAQRPDLVVHVAHLELSVPTIHDGVARCASDGATELTVVPYFLGPGRHVRDDVPKQVRAALKAHPEITAIIAQPLGVDPRLAGVVLERAGFAP